MTHSLPGTRPLAVPDIGFPQNISISLQVLDPPDFTGMSDSHSGGSTRSIDRVVWLPSPRPWFAVQRFWRLAGASAGFEGEPMLDLKH
jgi:hypothetical protein